MVGLDPCRRLPEELIGSPQALAREEDEARGEKGVTHVPDDKGLGPITTLAGEGQPTQAVGTAFRFVIRLFCFSVIFTAKRTVDDRYLRASPPPTEPGDGDG